MSDLHVLVDESNVILQSGFITATIFLAGYTTWYRWWRSVHGRTLGLLSIAVIVILGRSSLTDWHVIGADRPDSADLGTWIITNAAIILPVVFIMMTVQLIHSRFKKRGEPRSPLPAYKVPLSWKTYRPGPDVGWALSPQGEWFMVNGRTVVGTRRDAEAEMHLNQWLKDGTLQPSADPLTEDSGQHGLTGTT